MSFGFDPFAFGLALLVSVIAIIEYRRNNCVILRIKEADASGSRSMEENSSRFFSQLRIKIRNFGISLHDVRVVLRFDLPSGGFLTSPLLRYSPYSPAPINDRGEFAKGMMGDFGLKSYQMRPEEKRLLGLLKNPAAQRASLVIFAQGYFVKRYPIGTGRDLIAQRWNEFAARINRMFDRRVRRPGSKKTFHASGSVLPVFPSLMWTIGIYLRDIESEARMETPPPHLGVQTPR
jgi:hypothetical protein